MTQKLSAEEIIRDVIIQHYDLGEIGVPVALPSAHQRRHRKMVVETTKGRFLVKTYSHDPVILDSLRFQHRLSDHLYNNGLPVAHIERSKTGRGIVEMLNWALELQTFIEGGPMKIDSKSLRQTAEALGKLHQVCRDFPCPPRDAQRWRFSEVPRTSFQQLYQLALAERKDKTIVEHCNRIALFLRDAAKELDASKRSEFETGLIHGDWHGGNLMFKDDRLVAIVDLEFAGDGCYLEDIAYGLSNLAVRTTPDPNVLTARTNIILDYYQLHRSLSYAEMVALYYAVGVKHIATVSYQIRQLGGKVAGLTPAQWMEILAAQCDWLTECARKSRWGE